MRIADLAGQRVALWGWGREGRAAHAALRARLPELALTLFCSETEAAEAAALGDSRLALEHAATAARLSAFEVVVKSPGISPYRPEAQAASAAGTRFVGGTALWFAEHADDGTMVRTLCVTGTKGKSTTSSLLAHLLRASGLRTALAGNIGVPLLELLDAQADAWAVELSSYQTGDVAASGARPQVAIVTNLHPEHLDWHGSQQRYVEDKLALVTGGRPRVAVLNAADPVLPAVQMDAACVVVNLFMLPDEPELFRQCVQNIARVREDCTRYGMPLMIEPLVMLPNDIRGGYQVDGDAEKIVTLVRLAAEMGADIIKADPTTDPQDFDRVVEAARVPVLARRRERGSAAGAGKVGRAGGAGGKGPRLRAQHLSACQSEGGRGGPDGDHPSGRRRGRRMGGLQPWRLTCFWASTSATPSSRRCCSTCRAARSPGTGWTAPR